MRAHHPAGKGATRLWINHLLPLFPLKDASLGSDMLASVPFHHHVLAQLLETELLLIPSALAAFVMGA